MDIFIDSIASIGVSNLIVILCALIGAFVAIRLFQWQTFNAACNEFVSAFAPALARIDFAILHVGDIDRPEVNDFLRDNFEAHTTSVKKFAPHILSNRKRNAYEKAWKDYCDLEPNGGGITGFAGHYAPPGENYLEFIKDKIENILKFAKHK